VTLIPDWESPAPIFRFGLLTPFLGLPLAIFLFHNFLRQIPRELIEAGRVDGANWFSLFTRLSCRLSPRYCVVPHLPVPVGLE
jgi:alpha-glucoside transport system permease protein